MVSIERLLSIVTCSLWNSGTGSATLLENLLCKLVAKDILPVFCSVTVNLILNVNEVAKTRSNNSRSDVVDVPEAATKSGPLKP